jgi:tetratricopeptide (TPR) repeat protein
VWETSFSPDGRRILTASDDGTARVWDAVTGRPVFPPLRHSRRVTYAAFSADGRRIVTASYDQTARVWDAATGQPTTPPLKHNGIVWIAAFRRDGRRIVTASADQTARVWDAATGRPVTPPLKHNGIVDSASFSPDGRRVVTDSDAARIWDAATGRLLLLLSHDAPVFDAAFSPDGRRIVTAGFDQTARVWDAATGRRLLTLRHKGAVQGAAFSADGRWIVTAGRDQTARVWDAATGQPITPPLEHNGTVWRAVFSADGRRIVTASGDQTARVWDLPLDLRPVADLRRLAQWLAGYRIDAGAGAMALEPAAALQAGQALRAKYPAEFAASPAQVLAWHLGEADDAGRARDRVAVLPHLDALLAARPTDAALHARRGTVHAELGHWAAAAVDFAQAAAQEPDNIQFRYSQALAALAGGDTRGYQRLYPTLLAAFDRSDPPYDAALLLLALAVAPDGVTDAARLVALAERTVAAMPPHVAGDPYLVALGAALYRAGRLEEALQQLTEPSEATGGIMLHCDGLLLAMTHARLGHGAEARQWLERALPALDETLGRKPGEIQYSWDWRLLLQRLREEAESVVGVRR